MTLPVNAVCRNKFTKKERNQDFNTNSLTADHGLTFTYLLESLPITHGGSAPRHLTWIRKVKRWQPCSHFITIFSQVVADEVQ